MSSAQCPDWERLTLYRRSWEGEEPAEWQDSLEHLQTCSRCQDQAASVDPTLLFARLPDLEVSGEEIETMQQTVRQLSRLSGGSRMSGGRTPLAALMGIGSLGTRPAAWLRVAAMAALLVGALTLEPGQVSKWSEATSEVASLEVEVEVGDTGHDALPIELLDDRSETRLYHVADGDLPIVLIVDPTLPLLPF